MDQVIAAALTLAAQERGMNREKKTAISHGKWLSFIT